MPVKLNVYKFNGNTIFLYIKSSNTRIKRFVKSIKTFVEHQYRRNYNFRLNDTSV